MFTATSRHYLSEKRRGKSLFEDKDDKDGHDDDRRMVSASHHSQRSWSGWSSFTTRNSSSNVVIRRNLRLRSHANNDTKPFSCQFDTVRGGCKKIEESIKSSDFIDLGTTTSSTTSITSTVSTTSQDSTTPHTTANPFSSLLSFRQNKDQIKEEIRKLQEEKQRIARGIVKDKLGDDETDNNTEEVPKMNDAKPKAKRKMVKVTKKVKKLKRPKKWWDGPAPNCAWDGPKGCQGRNGKQNLLGKEVEPTTTKYAQNVVIEKSRFSNIINKRLEQKSEPSTTTKTEDYDKQTTSPTGKTIKETIKDNLRQRELEKRQQFKSTIFTTTTIPLNDIDVTKEAEEKITEGNLKPHKRHKRKLNIEHNAVPKKRRIYSVEEWLRMG